MLRAYSKTNEIQPKPQKTTKTKEIKPNTHKKQQKHSKYKLFGKDVNKNQWYTTKTTKKQQKRMKYNQKQQKQSKTHEIQPKPLTGDKKHMKY